MTDGAPTERVGRGHGPPPWQNRVGGATRSALVGHLGGQLQPLPSTAGQRGQRLADAEVAEPHLGEPAEDPVRGRRARLAIAEELLDLRDRHGEHLADVAAAELEGVALGLRPTAVRLEQDDLDVLARGADRVPAKAVGDLDGESVLVEGERLVGS